MNETYKLLLIGDKYQIKNLEEDITTYIKKRLQSSESFDELKEIIIIAKARDYQSIVEDAIDRMLFIFPAVHVHCGDDKDSTNSQPQQEVTVINFIFIPFKLNQTY